MKEDTFVGHLEELRKRIIIIILSILITSIGSYIYVDNIINILIKPIGKLIFIKPTEALFTKLKVAILSGILIALPVILYQIWQFIGPALFELEKKYLRFAIFFSYILFILGISFAYFIVFPIGIKFLLNMGTENIYPFISLSGYMDFLIIFVLAFGIIFQLPLVILILTQMKIITPKWLSNSRKHIILAIFIVAAIVTPGPDIFSQFAMAIPTLLLYEVSIILSKLVYKK